MGLDPDLVGRDARVFCAQHEALRTFVVRRETSPTEGEYVKGVKPYPGVVSLHVGRGRGATLWDEEEEICWLLAYSATHATHEDRDVYQHFMRLSSRDELLPTAADYEAIDFTSDPYLTDSLVAACQHLYEDARAAPGVEFNESFQSRAALILVDLMLVDEDELEEGWLAVSFERETALTSGEVLDLAARILPSHIDIDTLELAATFGRRPAQGNEIVFTWNYVPA